MTRILIHRCYAIYNENKRTVTADNFPDVMDCSDKYGEIEWQEMLGFLNEKQRIVVELYYGQQFKVREIGGTANWAKCGRKQAAVSEKDFGAIL